MERIGVVVLNYKKYQETIDCVNSLLRQDNIEMRVVVVDNGSKNKSADFLEDYFGKNDNVSIIRSDENLGYAKGNNLGIHYFLRKGYRFIFVANSDLVFTGNKILSCLVENYKERAGVLVPTIKNLNESYEQVVVMRKHFLLRIIKYVVLAQLRMYSKLLFNRVRQDKKFSKFVRTMENDIGSEKFSQKYYVISGSGFMLTPAFFSYYTGLYPETFLYAEEFATMIYLYKANLTSKMVKTEVIRHKGAASTDSSMKGKTLENYKMNAESCRRVFKLIFMSRDAISLKYSAFD